MRDFILIFGPPAVGKMTVGERLEVRLGYPLFHNHVSIEPALRYFPYGSPSFTRLVGTFREIVFEEAIESDLPGLIFTLVWDLDDPSDRAFVADVCGRFARAGARVLLVELTATQERRLERNVGASRLVAKPSMRDTRASEWRLLAMDADHTLNSSGPLGLDYPHLTVDNTDLSADAVADRIVAFMGKTG